MSLEGKQIDRYAIVRLLGSGGMGDVYLAEDPRIGQQVAIKVIRTELSPYPDEHAVQNAARLFQREAKAIVKLDHPHILPLYDYGEEHIGNAPVIYLVMPYRPEGSLTDWLRHRENKDLLTPLDITQLVSQAADALQHAHEHQVIHQDVKPSNFLVRARSDAPTHPDLLLSDFGIARLTTATSSVSQSIRGTPAYMAPEQWEGEPVFATDQYALAVMTYELLTGKLPFQGGPGKMMYHHINTSPPPPSTINPQLSSDIDTVLIHALAKQPDQRFASMKAFANAFQQAAQSMHGIQTIYVADRENAVPNTNSPVAVDEAEMMIPTLLNSGVQNAGSDSRTYVKPVDTPSTINEKVAAHEMLVNAQQDWQWERNDLPSGTVKKLRKPRNKVLLIGALVVMMLALIGGAMLYALPALNNRHRESTSVISGASSANVMITTTSNDLKNTYTLFGVTGNSDFSQHYVGVNIVSSATSSKSQTIQATGSGSIPATNAKGTLTLVNNGNQHVIFMGGSRLSTCNGAVNVVTDATVTIPAFNSNTQTPGTGYIPAHAVFPGSNVLLMGPVGNIPINCINQNDSVSNFILYNAAPFTGGANLQTYIFVRQSDIDNAANTLEQSSTPDAQQMIQPLVHANERLVGTPTCNPNVTSDQAAGDKAATVTVSVSFTCTGEVYDYDGALAMAAQLLTNQANTQLGSGYAPVGKIKTKLTSATLTDVKSGMVTLMVDAEGVWAYQFTDAQKQALARSIAGKTKSAAQTLLASQTGIGQVVITVSGGNNSTLPTDLSKITIVIKNASG